jgi:hypothetical protein
LDPILFARRFGRAPIFATLFRIILAATRIPPKAMRSDLTARAERVFLQVLSKPQIACEGKAQPDEKTQHIQIYVSILKIV